MTVKQVPRSGPVIDGRISSDEEWGEQFMREIRSGVYDSQLLAIRSTVSYRLRLIGAKAPAIHPKPKPVFSPIFTTSTDFPAVGAFYRIHGHQRQTRDVTFRILTKGRGGCWHSETYIDRFGMEIDQSDRRNYRVPAASVNQMYQVFPAFCPGPAGGVGCPTRGVEFHDEAHKNDPFFCYSCNQSGAIPSTNIVHDFDTITVVAQPLTENPKYGNKITPPKKKVAPRCIHKVVQKGICVICKQPVKDGNGSAKTTRRGH